MGLMRIKQFKPLKLIKQFKQEKLGVWLNLLNPLNLVGGLHFYNNPHYPLCFCALSKIHYVRN
mgnify:CR=1 FL=1